ncbi:2,3-butanediol dehydrogenase [Actinoplanes sp. TBRC 11911]|uniref:2,3-butanediol dehydrogenase n=1 Tax=Actinoplanes sp. TBRC 11911 TaxID=2729386 RepID=UPI00145DC5F9|nr:2,3-butanediol dehydrogenase [Actinoplanes sp. TBRC 11911]NMO56433.1 2,3-butanediol dehydrogenase [Actinoplanes sp. TBRC 11911]
MLAARFHDKGDIRLETADIPAPKSPDEVLVEVAWCGICGTDLHEYLVGPIVTSVTPHPLTGVTLPQTLGHEFSARVVEAGPEVTGVAAGDRVAVMPAIVCGRCAYCRRGLGHLCVRFACTGLSAETGGLAQYAVLKDYQVAKLPDAVSDVEGAVVEPASVAAYGVDRAGVHGGDVVLVTGAGPIGVLSALYANAVGAATVVIAEPNPNRAALARDLDVGPVLDPTGAGFDDAIAELTDGLGVDVVAECSGSTPGLATALTSVRSRGSIVQTGLHTRPATLDAMTLSAKDVTLVGSWCYLITDWPRIIRLIASGKYPVARAVTARIALPDVVTKGFDVLVDPRGDQLKVLASPTLNA